MTAVAGWRYPWCRFEVSRTEAVLDGFDRESDCQVTLADTGRSHEQDVLGLADEGARGEGFELRAVGPRLKGPVELFKSLAHR